jgi:hypothetical protein
MAWSIARSAGVGGDADELGHREMDRRRFDARRGVIESVAIDDSQAPLTAVSAVFRIRTTAEGPTGKKTQGLALQWRLNGEEPAMNSNRKKGVGLLASALGALSGSIALISPSEAKAEPCANGTDSHSGTCFPCNFKFDYVAPKCDGSRGAGVERIWENACEDRCTWVKEIHYMAVSCSCS